MMFGHSNSTVAEPFIRAPVGDIIDCHVFAGLRGDATRPAGDENPTKSARVQFLYPGLFIYHCDLQLTKNCIL